MSARAGARWMSRSIVGKAALFKSAHHALLTSRSCPATFIPAATQADGIDVISVFRTP